MPQTSTVPCCGGGSRGTSAIQTFTRSLLSRHCAVKTAAAPHLRVLRAICVPGEACPGPRTHLYHVQLGDAVLLHSHGQRNPIFLYNHLGVQAFPLMGNCVLGLLGEVP